MKGYTLFSVFALLRFGRFASCKIFLFCISFARVVLHLFVIVSNASVSLQYFNSNILSFHLKYAPMSE